MHLSVKTEMERTMIKKEDLRAVIVDEKWTGYFHGWGMDYEEFEEGPGQHTVAIIETEFNRVELVHPKRIRFYRG